jgi:hypothetical protein
VTSRALVLAAFMTACASPQTRETLRAPVAGADEVVVDALGESEVRALDALRVSVLGEGDGAREAAAGLGLTLGTSRGAIGITGEAARDDAVRDAAVVQRVGAAAVMLVTTVCGDAWLVGLAWQGGRWQAVNRHALVADARPGACRITRARAEACAMRSSVAREIVAVFSSGSEEGDEVRDPVLRLYHLGADGKLDAWSDDIPFGSTDDATGAVREAEWAVDDALQIPRDLYVQINPGQRGPGGASPAIVVRRTYRLDRARLVLAEERTEAYRPRGGAVIPQASLVQ